MPKRLSKFPLILPASRALPLYLPWAPASCAVPGRRPVIHRPQRPALLASIPASSAAPRPSSLRSCQVPRRPAAPDGHVTRLIWRKNASVVLHISAAAACRWCVAGRADRRRAEGTKEEDMDKGHAEGSGVAGWPRWLRSGAEGRVFSAAAAAFGAAPPTRVDPARKSERQQSRRGERERRVTEEESPVRWRTWVRWRSGRRPFCRCRCCRRW